jgi:conjugative relaxase-like TrwC/TraI family protein
MVQKRVCTSSEAMVNYHARHLASGDYHLEKGKVQGEFLGTLAQDWGLAERVIVKGDPRFEAFAELDLTALSGENLKRPRKSERQAVEFVYSAPKSVSIVAVLDWRIGAEMSAAVREELAWFERFACCRDRRGELYNSEAAKRTGKMLAAGFVHETSRAKDPDLHMHVLVANVTIDGDRNEALAMSYGEMLEMRKTLDWRIHNNLARRLGGLGYTVEVAEHGFRLREVPAPVEEIHSIRGREIQTAKKFLKEGFTSEQLLSALVGKSLDEKSQLWASGGIGDLLKNTPPGPPPEREDHEIDYQAWFITRRPKEITSAPELRTAVRRSFEGNGFDVFVAPEEKRERVVPMDLSKVIEQGVQAVFERESIVRVDHLVGEIVRLAPGEVGNAEIEDALKKRAEFVRKKISDHEMITTRAIIAEEQAIINAVKEGRGKKMAIVNPEEYQTPEELKPTYDRLSQLIDDAKRKDEEMTAELAKLWVEQHEAVNHYVMTSADQFLNIRGGAGVGKTYFMERLVRASLDAGRPVALVAPYGEQSRVTLRSEAEKATGPDAAQAFREANTVAWLLNKARFDPEFRESLRGADIYVDEASLLDNQTMLGLVSLARNIDARVIFQGDTQQLQAVGRGQPLAMLERELGFGMSVGRINVTRRQLRLQDKRLAQELSSGDAVRFSAAIETLIARGAIRSGGIDEAVQAILTNRNWTKPVDTIVLSSTHRLAERISEKLHDAYKAARPEVKMAHIAAFKLKELQPAELLSTASYKPGEMIDYQSDAEKPLRIAEVATVTANGIRVKGRHELLAFDKVAAVYSKTNLERGAGESLLLTEKIKQNGKIYENGSRQTIASIEDGKVSFESGLELDLQDGRLRQGDAVTTYKAQGASRTEMIRVEDNRSLNAMANREDLHVAFTRHRATARMFVQDIEVLRKAANRTIIDQATARDLETIARQDRIEQIVKRTFEQARRVAQRVKSAVQRRHELISELRFKKRQVKARKIDQKRSRGPSMSPA